MGKSKLIFTLFLFSIIIFVSCKNEDETAIKSIKIDPPKLTLKVGERKILQAIVEPDNAIYKTLIWSSSNEKVATIDKQTGEIYALKAGTTTIVATTIEGLKSEACYITVIEPDVYIVGKVYEKNNITRFVTLWKNGVAQRLGEAHYGSDYFSVFVTEKNDVYVAATTPDGPYEVATIWKNGVEQKLCNIWVNNASQARSVFVAGENVYVVGTVQGQGAIWINDDVQILDDDLGLGPSEMNFVYVDDNNVYVAGKQKGHATIWKNGVAQELSNEWSKAFKLIQSGNNLYVLCMIYTYPISYITVWKNNIIQIPIDSSVSSLTGANSFFVSNDNIYVVGNKYPQYMNQSYQALLWTNGVQQVLGEDGTGASANSVYVSGDDVYVVGKCKEKAILWKNGKPIILDNEHFGEAFSIFLK
ncbi:Ig-like domain-containing protein [uncultured Bacteroides sp.]|uniref:Ig-like domain-containing protein n=1 Tax=uncultured Bacteroides sp. TaxID=162156 RepID=UPI002AAA8E6A|nr:Ig-like domain-containing protein [uncultured Bacteroides sp.]